MRVLLVTVGSHGDIHPFIAMARALTARGHAAAILTNPHFAAQIEAEGIPCLPVSEAVDIKDLLTDGRAMHRFTGPMYIFKELILPLVPTFVEKTRAAIREFRADVVVVHSICIGASWAAAEAGLPCVHATLSPGVWFNPRDRIVLAPWRSERITALGVRTDLLIARLMTGLTLDRQLNRVRRSLGMAPRRGVWFGEALGGAINLGLWSPLVRGPLQGDPAAGRICGFPWFDRHRDNEAGERELERFLAAGEAPIVFTLGTAAVHSAGRFYEHAAGACRLLGLRGLLLVGRTEYLPTSLPPGVEAFTYAPYSTLLPRAAATAHHGGIGSTAQGLRAGRPTVVVPLSHDQFDNAARVKRMGVSETLHHSRVTPERLAGALKRVLENAGVAQTAADVGVRIAAEDGAARAAELIERLHGGRGRP